MLPNEVEFEPAIPLPGEPGSSFANARVSDRWPGLYTGRCRHCQSYYIAEKLAPRCDACEDRRLAAMSRTMPRSEGERLRAEFDQQKIERLTRVLAALTERFIQVARYAYGGLANPESEPVVQAARAAIEGAKKP